MKRIFVVLTSLFLLQASAWAQTDLAAIDAKALTLMEKGREALMAGKPATAYEAFNRVLMLPPNRYSQDAQEYVGVARERAKNYKAAKREYELYLRLYPDGDGAARVRQRLANLTPAKAAPRLRAVKSAPSGETSVYGGISQYYYEGRSHLESTTTFNDTTETSTLDTKDQSALVTNFDITGRYRSKRFDNRAVFRNTNTTNFTDTPDRNRVTAAYLETRDRELEYNARLGRQPGYHGGVLGRFDGALLSYQLLPKARVDLTAGAPVELYSKQDKIFYGINIDLGTFAESWGGAIYGIRQEADEMIDREAVGGELRYFDAKRTFFSLVDYDTYYNVVNTLLMNGSWQTAAKTNFTFMIDRRKSPAMQTSNALLGETAVDIETLLLTLMKSEVRQYAEARTADAELYLVGISQPLSPKWQIGGDVRFNEISGTEAAGSVPAMPGTGPMWTYTAQAIGTGLLTTRDSNIFSVSLIRGELYDGYSAFVTNRTLMGSKWAFDTAARWYQQEDQVGTTLTRLMPTFRIGYRMTNRATLETEVGYEKTTTEGRSAREATDRTFFFAGYRWDFY